ncbi:MAG: septum formation initiator family protein [Candidatus Omnitrophica bacterium]|nr:septum formation initiator family protein [Candidatus Omnitrophota bacterium]MBU1932728.1 septum formation initiator family protein [Candidatus Omnitrophota bacterium]
MAKIRIKPLYLVVAFGLIVIFLPGYTKFMDLRSKNAHLENEIERLERENVRLYREKQKLEEDIDYIEKVARESMGVAREGEVPIKLEKPK